MSTELNFYQYHSYFEESIKYWKSGLITMDRALRKVYMKGVKSHAYGIESIRRLYCEYYRISKESLKIMIIDWNILRECFLNVKSCDTYMKLRFEGENYTAEEKICEEIWKKGNVEDTSEISDTKMMVEGQYDLQGADSYKIHSSDIAQLDEYVSALQKFSGSPIAEYRANINEFRSFQSFKGRLADATHDYFYEVHSAILDALESMAEVLCNLIREYQAAYDSLTGGGSYMIDIAELTHKSKELQGLATLSEPGIIAYDNEMRYASSVIRGVDVIGNTGCDLLEDAARNLELTVRRIKAIESEQQGKVDQLRDCLFNLNSTLTRMPLVTGFRILNYYTNGYKTMFVISGINPLLDLDTKSPDYLMSKLLTPNGYPAMSSDEMTKFLKKYGIVVDADKNPYVYDGMARFYREYTRRGGSSRFAAEQLLKVVSIDPNLLSQYYFNSYLKSHVNASDANQIREYQKKGIAFPNCDASEDDFMFDIACHPMVVIPQAVKRADHLAWDDRHGYLNYDPVRRFGPYDYDCISLVAQVYIEQGIPLRATEYQDPDGKTILSTGLTDQYGCNLAVDQLPKALLDNGFEQINVPLHSADLEPGYILLNSHHGEICIGHEQTVSASMVDAWYDDSPGDQRRFGVDENGVKHGTLDAFYNGEISRDVQVGEWHNVVKEWDGVDYFEDSHDYYDGTFDQAYRYVGKTGIARIDYKEIQQQLEWQIDYKDIYVRQFAEADPDGVRDSQPEGEE